MNTHATNDELNKIQIMERNNYTIHNSTNLPVEEDSDYNISLISVNSNVSSPATIVIGATKEAGMHTRIIMLVLIFEHYSTHRSPYVCHKEL